MLNVDCIIKEHNKVFIDFWATWCGPCKMTSPIVDEIEEERPDIKVVKVNIDDEPEVADKYEIRSIPAFKYFKDGLLVKEAVGAMDKKRILDLFA